MIIENEQRCQKMMDTAYEKGNTIDGHLLKVFVLLLRWDTLMNSMMRLRKYMTLHQTLVENFIIIFF